jgi:hypothetical protein
MDGKNRDILYEKRGNLTTVNISGHWNFKHEVM